MSSTLDLRHEAIIRFLRADYELGRISTSEDLARLFCNRRFRAVARTAKIDQYRAEQRERRFQNELLPKHTLPQVSSPLESLVIQERWGQVQVLVAELPQRERRVIQAADLSDCTIAKLSRATGESESALRSLRHRGLARMRRRAQERGWTL